MARDHGKKGAAEAGVAAELEEAKGASTSKLYVLLSCNCAAATALLQLSVQTLQNSKATLPVGSRGVLVSCIGGKEQYAAKDSIRILTEVLRLNSSAMLYRSPSCSRCSFP